MSTPSRQTDMTSTSTHGFPVARRFSVLAMTGALAITAVACGSDDTTGDDAPVITTTPDETIPDETIPDGSTPDVDEPTEADEIQVPEVSFESEPVEGGALFGSGSDAAAAGESDEPSTDDVSAEPCPPDVDNCVEIPDVIPPPEPHVIDEEWVPFCGLVARLEDEPIPSDEIEQFTVLQAWFRELATVVPTAISEQLDVLIDLVDAVVDAESLDPVLEDDGVANRAADEVGTAVDLECYGDG